MEHPKRLKGVDSGVRKAFGHGLCGLFLSGFLLLVLFVAVGCGQPALTLAIEQGNDTEVARLISAGANVNQHDFERNDTPLHAAAEKGAGDAAKLLLKAGADTHAVGCCKDTPFTRALRRHQLDVAKILLEAEKPSDRKQVVDAALILVASGDSCAMFADSGKAYETWLKDNAESVRFLIERGADANVRSTQGNTVLHVLAASKVAYDVGYNQPLGRFPHRGSVKHSVITLPGNPYVATLLVEHGANVEAKNDAGRTPYEVAVAAGNPGIAAVLAKKHVPIRAGAAG